jgi:hypothetical protein
VLAAQSSPRAAVAGRLIVSPSGSTSVRTVVNSIPGT